LQLAAARVSATPGTREQMEARVLSVISTSTKQDWGLHLALIARQTLSLLLAALLTPRVSATPGTREQMEIHVLSAIPTSTKQDCSLHLVLIARQTLSLPLEAS